jgi:aquaporin Z
MIISFTMMGTVLIVSNSKTLDRYTGLFAGALVFAFITLEAPFSGMSMNPARSLSSAVPARVWSGLWIYLSAPVLGMLVAAEADRLIRGRHAVFCAKLNHQTARRCIFCCSRTLLLPILIAAYVLGCKMRLDLLV